MIWHFHQWIYHLVKVTDMPESGYTERVCTICGCRRAA